MIILSSFMQMHKLFMDHQWYMETYAYMPDWMANLRYCFSWFQRFVGLAAAIGFLFYKDIFRKLAVLLGVFTICTVYWKHPLAGFQAHALYLDKRVSPVLEDVSFADLAVYSMVIHIILDIIFQGSLIYYLTRKKVKAQFS